ncbi:cupin domain-containing protein [Streptomyces galbus]|jgi:quercetin dioxygenase-like cupin family protein|uniref:Cupin domain-containing protein n=1 Tax=Streptomyces galbus TaxID=33898 RepID=A0ABX1IDA8_STRGB|nr:cupin domain-containing protein [Streptomyces galbus]NKQ23649.1 cupin domain-containing protein [Streptomyces galbus]
MTVAQGEVYDNPRCRERVVIRTPAAETGGERTVMDVYVQPGGAVSGAHVHPLSEERFTLVRGRVAFLVDGRETVLTDPGQSILIPPGAKHRWWNAGDVESRHVCELRGRADRFEQLVLRQLFGLAQDGLTTAEGMPHLLQQAVTTMEFRDVLRFTSPAWPVQRLLFGVLAPVARLAGYRGCNPEYLRRKPSLTAELEPLPAEVAAWHY